MFFNNLPGDLLTDKILSENITNNKLNLVYTFFAVNLFLGIFLRASVEARWPVQKMPRPGIEPGTFRSSV